MKKSTPYWTRVIQNAKRRKAAGRTPFTKDNVRLAEDWVTCACGKQDWRIPRFVRSYQNGSPVDSEMQRWGMDFMVSVRGQDPNKAGEALAQVERRAIELIKEQEKP